MHLAHHLFSIANTIEALIDMVQNVKRNKDECAQLMENIHPVLYAIINLHLKAETVESLSPEMLHNIGSSWRQQDGNRIKYLFRNNEVQKLSGIVMQDWTRLWKSLRLPPDLSVPTQTDHRSTSFSMLPSKPKIFYGRQSEVETIMKMLNQESPRIAILGGGGMGKTSLAKASCTIHRPWKNSNTGFLSVQKLQPPALNLQPSLDYMLG
ncbi:hypothetical protein B0H14DRAFT_2632271 [Mycena olivaceomarginata]|nr:hypothetical protein B0H14DRAFT_2632271 [Mycena olivaceomarginata]